MSVIRLHKPIASHEVSATLRRIADQIEAGDYGIISTAALCLGHTEIKPADESGIRDERDNYELFGMGPRDDVFSLRGLLLTCATRV